MTPAPHILSQPIPHLSRSTESEKRNFRTHSVANFDLTAHKIIIGRISEENSAFYSTSNSIHIFISTLLRPFEFYLAQFLPIRSHREISRQYYAMSKPSISIAWIFTLNLYPKMPIVNHEAHPAALKKSH